MKTITYAGKQNGAALVVGLVLLVVVTVLAISGMNTATTELAIARNDQNYENAFQAAETGLEYALAQGLFNTTTVSVITQDINTNDEVSTEIAFEETTPAPEGYSLDSGVVAYHFVATATAASYRVAGGITETDRDASAVHTQAFYTVGPAAPTL